MNSNLFKRYVWLIDVVNHAGKITYDEISNLWESSPINADRESLALRTFHNHREAIETLFGIRIVCNRKGGNKYSLDMTGPLEQSTKLKVWMLQMLSNSYSLNMAGGVESRVLVDVNPEEQYGLQAVIEAMSFGQCVRILNSVPLTKDNLTEFVVEPYCVKFWGNSWYVLGKNHATGEMMVFDLSRVLNLEFTEEEFKYDMDFKPVEFFRNYYGMDVDTSMEPVTVRLRIGDGTRDLIRTQLLHDTQKEVMADQDSSIFEYHLVPGSEFKHRILSMGDDAEVVSPQTLREEMADTVRRMAEKYSR